jgi:adenine/guanine phosphoribosyltransferase-like PRPP-binding protein
VYGKEFLKLVPRTVKKIRAIRRKYPFDAIAFTGSSGAALAYPLSYLLKLPLIHVRKGSSHYSGGKIEGTISSKRYLIIDDFIETGASIRRLIKAVSSELDAATPVAICLYSSNRMADFDYKDQEIPVFTVSGR